MHNGERRTLDLSVRSLERWEIKARKGGVGALARDGRGGWSPEGPSDEAVAAYWAKRNDPRRFSVATAWREIAHQAKARGWRRFDKLETCRAWDRRTRNERALTLNQRGDLAYTQRCGPYIEIAPESFEPGECWVGDDSTINAWVRLPNGDVVRLTISVWLDWRTRTVVGFRVVRFGNEHSLLLAFADGAKRYGLPATVIVDNGRNFTSWQWRGGRPKYRRQARPGVVNDQTEGIFALCGVNPSYALPFNPNGKARLEWWFGTLDDQCIRSLPSYCGPRPEDRPEAHAALVAKAVDWDVFVDAVRRWIDVYNETPHSGEGMDGRTPLQVMALASRKRPIPEGVADLLLAAWQRPVSVQRNGVAIRVAGATLRYGQFEPALNALNPGTKVRVGYDPNDLSSVTVWSMDYRLICRAELNRKHNRSVNSEQLRETMRQIASEKRRHRQSRKDPFGHLRDPMERSIAAQADAAARRRKPDPPRPDGGPNLIPLQTPLKLPVEGPPAAAQPLRRAVGSLEDLADFSARFSEFTERCRAERREQQAAPKVDLLSELARRGRK